MASATNQPGGIWIGIAQDELFFGWKRWLSFACIWVWSCLSMRFSIASGVFSRLPQLLSIPNEVVLLSTACTLLVILSCSKCIPTVVGSKSIMGVAGGFLSMGSLLYCAGMMAGSVELVVAGMVLGGVAIALLKVAWGEMYSVMGLQRSLVSLSYAVIFSSVLVLLAMGLPLIVLEIALLGASFPCAWLVYSGHQDFGRTRMAERAAPVSVPLRFSPALLILPLMVGFSYGIVKGVLPLVAADANDSVRGVLIVASAVAGVVLLAFSYRLNDRFGAAQVYSVGLIFVVAGLIALAIRGPFLRFALSIHDVGFSIFYFFMIVHWGDLSRRTGLPIVRTYATGYFCFQGIQALTSVAVYFATRDGSFSDAPVLFTLSAVFALFIASLLLFGDGRSPVRKWLVAQDSLGGRPDAVSESCRVLAERHELSPREREVLALLARGRNASHIAQSLCISPDTAKSHIKSIYRKMSVHTQQELLDRIEDLTVD